MKKVLSIMLVAMMLASLFVVNVSAAPVANYETVQISLFSQDYQDASKTEWTASYGNGQYARGFAEKVLESEEEGETNYVINFTANPEKTTMILTGPQTSIERDDFVIEFDARGVSPDTTLDVVVKNPYHSEKAPTGWLVKLHSGTFGTEGKWYSFKVVANLSAVTGTVANNDSTNFKVYWKERGGSQWSALTHYGANANTSPSYRTLVGSNAASNGESTSWTVSFQCPSSYATGTFVNTNYQLDNINVYYEEEQFVNVVDGAIVTQDFEDASITNGTTAHFGLATVTKMESEDGNTYYKYECKSGDTVGNIPVLWGQNLGFNSYGDVNVTFDIMAEKPGAFGIELYGATGNSTYIIVRAGDEGHELGDWYRYKISAEAIGKTYAAVARKNLTDDTDWEKLQYAENAAADDGKSNYGTHGAASNMTSAVRFCNATTGKSKFLPVDDEGNTVNPTECVYYVDNISITSVEKIAVSDIEATETTVSATIDYSDAGNWAWIGTEETYSVVMVSYDTEGRVVDVAMQTPTPVAGDVENVELSVDKTDDVRVYVWETTSGEPLLGNVFDLDAWF